MKYKIEITDEDANSCRFRLTLPASKNYTDEHNSRWRVMDEGYIKYRSGSCQARSSTQDDEDVYFSPIDLRFYRGTKWGLVLYEFTGWDHLRVNDSGTGTILQPWCLSLVPYHITWTLID